MRVALALYIVFVFFCGAVKQYEVLAFYFADNHPETYAEENAGVIQGAIFFVNGLLLFLAIYLRPKNSNDSHNHDY